MGRTTRNGYGYGMTEADARTNFAEELSRMYGEDLYEGGGNDIRDWLKSKCVENPVPGKSPTKTKVTKVTPKRPGKLVNGFKVTNETREFFSMQARALHGFGNAPTLIEDFSLTAADATKKAQDLAKRHNCEFLVIPWRLWQDAVTKKLSQPEQVKGAQPIGGTEDKPGKWYFEVEVAI